MRLLCNLQRWVAAASGSFSVLKGNNFCQALFDSLPLRTSASCFGNHRNGVFRSGRVIKNLRGGTASSACRTSSISSCGRLTPSSTFSSGLSVDESAGDVFHAWDSFDEVCGLWLPTLAFGSPLLSPGSPDFSSTGDNHFHAHRADSRKIPFSPHAALLCQHFSPNSMPLSLAFLPLERSQAVRPSLPTSHPPSRPRPGARGGSLSANAHFMTRSTPWTHYFGRAA